MAVNSASNCGFIGFLLVNDEKFYCECVAPKVNALYDKCNLFREVGMSRPLRFTDLFFESGRRRWNQNLFVKLGLGCLALLCLLCCALTGLGLWLSANVVENFPRIDNRPRPALVFSPEALPAATVGEPYEATISVSQNVTPTGDFYLSKDELLPPGLSLGEVNQQESSVQITGTPTEAGSYTFTVNVWCYGTSVSGQMGAMEYTITVNP
jgi:hypothetical protein